MAVLVLKNVGCTIAGTDLSDHVREVEIDDGVVELENTVMTNVAENMQGGLKKWTITFKLLQDYAGSKTHAVLRALVNTNAALIIRVDKDTIRSGTNPEFQATGFFSKYVPIGGAVGVLQEPMAVFKNAGTGISELTTAT